MFVARDGRQFAHTISTPQRVQIDERDDGFVAAIGFVSSSEPETILQLHEPLTSKRLPRATD
jgi:hypothetical protein